MKLSIWGKILLLTVSSIFIAACGYKQYEQEESNYHQRQAYQARITNQAASPKNACCYKKQGQSCDFYKKNWPQSYYYQNYCASSYYYKGCCSQGCTTSY